MIDQKRGILSTSGKLDFEDTPFYRINVVAEDQDEQKLASYINLH